MTLAPLPLVLAITSFLWLAHRPTDACAQTAPKIPQENDCIALGSISCGSITDCCAGDCQGAKCCIALGSMGCGTSTDCCTGTCQGAKCCIQSGSMGCGTSTECCAGDCQARKCCIQLGSMGCGTNTDCCAGTCEATKCCIQQGESGCNSDDDCCETQCVGGTCCLKSGEALPSACPANNENDLCCSGLCGDTDKCCIEPGKPCVNTADCCFPAFYSCTGSKCCLPARSNCAGMDALCCSDNCGFHPAGGTACR